MRDGGGAPGPSREDLSVRLSNKDPSQQRTLHSNYREAEEAIREAT